MSQTTRALASAVRQARVGVWLPLAALGTSVATVALGAALLGTSGYLISRAAERPPILALGVAMVLVRAFSVARAIMRYLERLASHELALGALARLRASFVGRLIPLVPAGLPRLRAADLMSRFTADVDQLQELFLRGLLPPIAAVVLICLAGVAAALMLPAAGVVLVVVLAAFAIVVPTLTGAVARAAGKRQARARAELSSRVVDVLEGAPDIVAWGVRDAHIAGVTEANDTLMKLGRRDAYAGGIAAGLGGLGAQAAALAVLIVAVPAVRDGRLGGVLLAALVLMTLAVFEAIAPLPVAAQNLTACGQAAVRLEECVDRPVPIVDPDAPAAPGPGRTLVLRDACVRFGPGAPLALEGINLELRWGRAVAIVGPSGSGKTTLCEVLARLRDLDSGQALLDGIPLEDLRQSDVRHAVTLVPQDAYLFPTTIAANLRIARPDATDVELDAALARAGPGRVGRRPARRARDRGRPGRGAAVRRPTPTADTGAWPAGARRAAGPRRADLAPGRRVRGGLPRRRASGRCHGAHGAVHRDPPTGRHGPLRRDRRDRRRRRAGTRHARRAARGRWLVRVDGERDGRLGPSCRPGRRVDAAG